MKKFLKYSIGITFNAIVYLIGFHFFNIIQQPDNKFFIAYIAGITGCIIIDVFDWRKK